VDGRLVGFIPLTAGSRRRSGFGLGVGQIGHSGRQNGCWWAARDGGPLGRVQGRAGRPGLARARWSAV